MGERPGIARPSMITTRPAGAPCASGWSSCSFTRAAPAVSMTPQDIAARLTAERAMWFACTKHARSVVGRPLFSPVCGRLQRRWLARASAAAAGPDGPRSELGRSSSRLRLVLLQLPPAAQPLLSPGWFAGVRRCEPGCVRRCGGPGGPPQRRGSAETRPRGGVCFVLGFVIMATSLAKCEKPHGKRLGIRSCSAT